MTAVTKTWWLAAACGAWLAVSAPVLAQDVEGAAAQAAEREREEARKQREEARKRQFEDQYRRAQELLEDGRWSEAVARLESVIEAKLSRTDAALYWKAYALDKLQQQADALAAVAELAKAFPTSRWLSDAKALELQVRQHAGQPLRPEEAADEELKLLAIQALQHSSPDQAVPMLEKFLAASQSLRLKQRALFVLAQSASARAREVLTAIARGGANPDLQGRAIQYLGVSGTRENRQILYDIYRASTDVEAKRQILQALFVGDDAERLIELARTEPNAELRRTAVRQLGTMSAGRTGAALVALYTGEKDAEIRRQAVNGLFIQNNAEALVAIARKETDPRMKKELVTKLSLMQSKVALDYLMEILNK